MPIIFPEDSSGTGAVGAVHLTLDGNDFFVPSREQGSESLKGSIQSVIASGTSVQLPNYACREVTVIALEENTGDIYLGGSDVSSSVYGVKLKPRDSITLKLVNTNLIYIDSSVSGEGVSYVAI